MRKNTPNNQSTDGGASSSGQRAAAHEQLSWRRTCGGNGSCVEIATLPDGGTALRDGKAGDVSPVLIFSPEEWREFVAGVRAGEFD